MNSPATHLPSLDSLRLISAFAVILLHVSVLYVTSASTGSPHWWAGNLLDANLRWCVPFFVMISGALLFPKLQAGLALGEYFRKRRRLLWVFLFWQAVYLTYHWIGKTQFLERDYSLATAITHLWHRPAHYHLWYLYMILPLLALAPLFARIRAFTSAMLIALVGASGLWWLHYFGLIPQTPLLLRWVEFIGYFMAGHYLLNCNIAPRAAWLALISGACIALLTFYQAKNTANPYVFYQYHSPAVMLQSLCLFAGLRAWIGDRPLSSAWLRLSPLALGIYLIHPIFLDLIRYNLPLAQLPIILLPIAALAVAAASIISVLCMQRIDYLRKIL